MASGLLASFLGALQASVSVLLTIVYGGIAASLGFLSESSAKDISQVCVNMFLPALLVYSVGSQLNFETSLRYVPVLVYSISYNVLSMALGIVCTRIFDLPAWVTPAITFNNTTSLPLLLVQSLETAGIFSSLLRPGESSSSAVKRAKSYFLVNAMVSNSMTFALGPRFLSNDDNDTAKDNKSNSDRDEAVESSFQSDSDTERGDADMDDGNASTQDTNEQTSLLPSRLTTNVARQKHKISRTVHKTWDKLPKEAQSVLDIAYQFANPSAAGALLGAILGLVPVLHKAFFSPTNEGGIFTAWFTSSIENIGDLFASLQTLVVGIKLWHAMQRMRAGEASGKVPWSTFTFVTMVRYVIWPAISILVIWLLASKTSVLRDDPVLWFTMMLMPTGPPALKLTALADVNGSGEEERLSIAKFLTASYLISPLICFTVVGSLKASEAALGV